MMGISQVDKAAEFDSASALTGRRRFESDIPSQKINRRGGADMSRVKLELVGTKYKELVDTCVKRVEDGLDCSGCPFENGCDDFIREVVGIDARLFDR